MEKKTFHTIITFKLIFYNFMAHFPFEKHWCVHFLRQEGSKKMYVLYRDSFKCWQLWMALKDNSKSLNLIQCDFEHKFDIQQWTVFWPSYSCILTDTT